jgi:hypothetical protein
MRWMLRTGLLPSFPGTDRQSRAGRVPILFPLVYAFSMTEDPDHDPETLVAQPLKAYRGWRLEVTCQHCGTMGRVEVSDLHDRYGDDATIRDIVERLACRDCRGLPSSIELRHHMASKWILKPPA